jgi:hypothetical protein
MSDQEFFDNVEALIAKALGRSGNNMQEALSGLDANRAQIYKEMKDLAVGQADKHRYSIANHAAEEMRTRVMQNDPLFQISRACASFAAQHAWPDQISDMDTTMTAQCSSPTMLADSTSYLPPQPAKPPMRLKDKLQETNIDEHYPLTTFLEPLLAEEYDPLDRKPALQDWMIDRNSRDDTICKSPPTKATVDPTYAVILATINKLPASTTTTEQKSDLKATATDAWRDWESRLNERRENDIPIGRERFLEHRSDLRGKKESVADRRERIRAEKGRDDPRLVIRRRPTLPSAEQSCSSEGQGESDAINTYSAAPPDASSARDVRSAIQYPAETESAAAQVPEYGGTSLDLNILPDLPLYLPGPCASAADWQYWPQSVDLEGSGEPIAPVPLTGADYADTSFFDDLSFQNDTEQPLEWKTGDIGSLQLLGPAVPSISAAIPADYHPSPDWGSCVDSASITKLPDTAFSACIDYRSMSTPLVADDPSPTEQEAHLENLVDSPDALFGGANALPQPSAGVEMFVNPNDLFLGSVVAT